MFLISNTKCIFKYSRIYNRYHFIYNGKARAAAKSTPANLRKLLWVVMVEFAIQNSFGVVLYSVGLPRCNLHSLIHCLEAARLYNDSQFWDTSQLAFDSPHLCKIF